MSSIAGNQVRARRKTSARTQISGLHLAASISPRGLGLAAELCIIRSIIPSLEKSWVMTVLGQIAGIFDTQGLSGSRMTRTLQLK